MRDMAWLAMRASVVVWRPDVDVARCCAVWPQLAERFEAGELVAPAEMRVWVAGLADAEAQQEEEDRIRRGAEPEQHKAQATERVRRKVAKWRIRSPRVYLRDLLGPDDAPLLDGEAVGAVVHDFWGEFSAESMDVKIRRRRNGSWALCRTSAHLSTGESSARLFGKRRRGRVTRHRSVCGMARCGLHCRLCLRFHAGWRPRWGAWAPGGVRR